VEIYNFNSMINYFEPITKITHEKMLKNTDKLSILFLEYDLK